MDYSPTKIKLIIVLYLMLCLHLSITSITGSVVLIPPKNYTVFKNNASASFYCYGDGYVVAWYLNGTAYNAMHAQMGIRVVPNPPTGTMVSSTLYIPSTSNSTNNKTNNTEVFCKVADTTFTNIQTSVPANLTIQGPLDAPYNFSVAMSNTSFNLSWGAPFSLHVTGYPADIFNYTLCTNITIYGCKTIPSDPDCTFPRNCTSSVDFTEPSLNSTNKTIMDYGDTIVFIFAAINGAGIGNMSEYIYHINGTDSKVQVSPNTTETVRNTASTISYTNDSKTDLSIGAVRIGLISTAVVVIVVIIITFIIAAIRCSIMKRKAQFERNELTHVHADSSHADGCNYYSTQQTQVEDLYFMPVSDFRSTTSQDPDKSCIESGIQHQSNQEQFHCKGESSYADVLCVPVISISAPKQEVTYSEVRNTEAAQSVPVTQPSEQISSTPPPKYDNVVLPAESNKLEQTEPPKHMNEAYSNPYSKGGSRIDCDEYDEDVEEGVEDSIKDTPKVTSSPPSSGIRRRNPNQQRTESDGDEEGFEEEIKDFMKDDIPKAYLPSGNRSQHLRRTECDEDDDDDEEEIKDLVKDDIPKQYKYPSNNRSQRLCQRVDCDGDDEDIEGTTMDWMKKDMLQVSSSASHDSSQCQQCTEYDGDEENDWCNNSTTEKEATVPKQFTSGVLVKTGCDDSKQRTNHRTISEDIKYDDNSSFVFSFTHFKTEHIEGQNLPTSKESSMSDDASSDDERKTVEQSNWLMHWHSIIRPQYLRPVDMPILSTVVPSVNVKEQSFEKSCMYEETGCGIHGHVHVHDTLNADYCLKCATDNQTEQAEVALEVAGTDTATCLSMDESPRAFFKQYVESKIGAVGVGKTHLQHFLVHNPAEQCFSTGLADNPTKTISSSLEDDWFVFKNEKQHTGNTNAIKGGLDDVHWTQPKPVAMFSWFPVAVISKLLISLLLLMSGDIEENPGPEGPEGEGNDERLKYSEFITTIVQYASDRITEDIKKKINTVCVIILACSENELRASAVEMIEEENIIQVDYKTGTKLYLGKLADCACGIVVTGQGKHSKSDVKEILKTCINAKLIISLGVTAGLGKSKLDDVLIATKIAHYDEGKVQNDGFFSDGETKNVYKIVEKIFSQAALFTWDFPCAINWRKSKYISGLIDSDPYLLDSKLWVDRMGITNAEAKGYEMEGHILQWIAEEEENRDLNFIIIKCVCDSANGSKSKEWQYTGAKAAASYTKTRLTMSETYKSSIVASHYLNISNEKEVKDHQSNTWKTYMQLVKANMVYSSPSNDRSFANANLICRPFQCPIFGDDENGWCQNSISKKEATVPQQFTSDVLVETGSVPQQFTCDKTGSCVWPFIHVQLQNEHSEGHTLPTSKESDISNDASSIDEGRIMEQGDLWNIIWTRTETNFGAAGVGKMRLQHFPMNDHPEQCFGTGLADDSIKDMFSSLEQHWVLLQIFIQLIGKAIKAMVSCYLKIMIGKEMKDQAKTWKTYIQAVKAIGGSVVFWLPLDVAYGALDVQALYAKGIVE